MKGLLWVLNSHNQPQPCDDYDLWKKWYYGKNNRLVGLDRLHDSIVITTFMGMNAAHKHQPPKFFLTTIFGGIFDGHLAWYSTWERADTNHKKICAALKELANYRKGS